jgi:hypothetical protein
MTKRGFHIGAKVELTKRISLNFPPYADVTVGMTGFIKGETGGEPIVTFTKRFGKVDTSCDGKVNINNLKLAVAAASDKPAKNDKPKDGDEADGADQSNVADASKLPKNLSWLKDKSAEKPDALEVVQGWAKTQARDHEDMQVKLLHGLLGFALGPVIQTTQKLDTADLTLVKRNGDLEVWTTRDFAAGTLVLAPETNEWKSRNWSLSASTIVKYDVGTSAAVRMLAFYVILRLNLFI